MGWEEALALGGMAGGTALSAYGQQQGLDAQGKALEASQRIQNMENSRAEKVNKAQVANASGVKLGSTIASGRANEGNSLANVAQTITDAYAANAAPSAKGSSSTQGQITGTAQSVAADASSAAPALAGVRAPGIALADQQVQAGQFGVDRARIRGRSQDEASLLPGQMMVAGQKGSRLRQIAQLMALAGQGAYSDAIYKGGPAAPILGALGPYNPAW